MNDLELQNEYLSTSDGWFDEERHTAMQRAYRVWRNAKFARELLEHFYGESLVQRIAESNYEAPVNPEARDTVKINWDNAPKLDCLRDE